MRVRVLVRALITKGGRLSGRGWRDKTGEASSGQVRYPQTLGTIFDRSSKTCAGALPMMAPMIFRRASEHG